MINVVTGSNDFLRTDAWQRMQRDFIKEYGEYEVQRLDASESDLSTIISSVQSLPFLSLRRLVLLTSVTANKTLAEHIDELIEKVSDTTELIIVEPKFDKRSNLYKTLKKQTSFIEYNEPSEQDLIKWVITYVASLGASLSRQDAVYLIDRVGTSQQLLSNEIDKLTTYSIAVTRDTIDHLTERVPKSTVFEMLDSIFSGDKKRSLRLYEEQRRQQIDPQAVAAMIIWQIHVCAVLYFNKDLSSNDVVTKTKINPYTVRKTEKILANMSTQQIKQLIYGTLELDMKLKTTNTDPDEALKHFLLAV